MSKKRLGTQGGKFILLSLVAAASLNAQTQNVTLDAAIVTATGFESALKEETRNIFAVTKTDIEAYGYRSVKELVEKIPSVDFVSTSSLGENIDMRGQGMRGDGATPTMAVKIMLNGVPTNMVDAAHGIIPLEMIAIEDIEQVEVMPGGGAVLYGSGTRGGVVNIITKQKPRDFFANMSSKIGSYSYRDAAATVGGNVSEDLFLKFSGKAFGQKGYRHDYKERGYYLSGELNYKFNDSHSLNLTPSIFKSKRNDPGTLTQDQVSQNRKQNANNGLTKLFENEKIDVSAVYEGKFNDFYSVNLMPYYQKIKIKTSSTESARGVRYPSQGLFGDKKYGVNFKNKLDYGSGEFIFGYDYEQNKGDRESHYEVKTSPIISLKHDTTLDLQKTTHALYFMEKHKFTQVFDLSFGYRFERAQYEASRVSDMKGFRNGIPFPPMTSYNAISDGRDIDNHAFEFTPNFRYSDTGNVYFKFERGYISPSPSQLTDKDQVTKQYKFNDLKSEKFNTYEIGLKDHVASMPVNATVFLTDTSDEIAYAELGANHGDAWKYYNIAKTRRYGFEFFSRQNVFDRLILSQSYAYVNATIKKGNNAGKEVPYVSKHKFIFGADYEIVNDLHVFADYKFLLKEKGRKLRQHLISQHRGCRRFV